MSLILPPHTPLYQTFADIVARRKLVFFAGLPGAGKSLLLKQLVLLAQAAGRTVDLLQWDVVRSPFETPHLLQQFPEVDGVTHAAIRKGVGLWARTAVHHWHTTHLNDNHMLIGETPLIGNRLMELAQPHDDNVEAMLSSEQTLFLVPVPSAAVRRHIETAREQSIADPQHEKETKDAPPNVLRALWQEVAQLGYQLNLTDTKPVGHVAYEPEVYTAVYHHLLPHRHHHILPITTILQPSGSAYDLTLNGHELAATPEAVNEIMTAVQHQYTPAELDEIVSRWYEV
ncbi:MAG: hypothetical protein H6658_03790 [Ardenticatenaceae bacterium]|nr:hypothetical protein [Ardenticatenaceae bacterium]